MDVKLVFFFFFLVTINIGPIYGTWGYMHWKGERGDPGYRGLPGPRGYPGQDGKQGIQGPPGQKGDMGLPGPFGHSGLPGPKGHAGVKGPKGEKGESCKAGEIGSAGPAGPKGENGNPGEAGHPGLQGAKGDKGLKGERGSNGGKGAQGKKGETGSSGRPGPPGKNGDQGIAGPAGPIGPKGNQGPAGTIGPKGDQGPAGPIGPKGDQGPAGTIGPKGDQGTPGMPGVCPVACPATDVLPDGVVYAEGHAPLLGSKDRPSSLVCKFKPINEEIVKNTDDYWIKQDEKFPTKCDVATNRTCLILNEDFTDWIAKTKFVIRNAGKGVWLSKTGFDLKQFNTISNSQISFLRQQSDNVRQVIRFYFMNTTFESLNLRILNNFDDLIDKNPSDTTPMHYTVENNGGTVVVNGKTWKYVDIVIMDEIKRLPVNDFYVKFTEDPKEVYVSLQLRQLCFG